MSTGEQQPDKDFPDTPGEAWNFVDADQSDFPGYRSSSRYGLEENPEPLPMQHPPVSGALTRITNEADTLTATYIRERGPLTTTEKRFLRHGFDAIPQDWPAPSGLGLAIGGLQRHAQLSTPVEALTLGARGLRNITLYGKRHVEQLQGYMEHHIPELPLPELPSPAYAAFLTNNLKEIPAFFMRTTAPDQDVIMPLVGLSMYDCLANGADILPANLHATREADRVIADIHGYARRYSLARLQYVDMGVIEEA